MGLSSDTAQGQLVSQKKGHIENSPTSIFGDPGNDGNIMGFVDGMKYF
jgi:hypothetical protein